jgi:predicted protein tyrosine phosphatase
MRLVVCPADAVADLCRSRRPSHLLSLRSPGRPAPDLPAGLAPAHRLCLAAHDVAEPAAGLVAPDADFLARMLAFARSWPGDRPLLVHCAAGVSRSPAAALAIACQRRSDLAELVIAQALRAAAPQATPNPLILALADDALGRAGRLAAAGQAIGRGAEFAGAAPFELALDAI